MIKVNCDGLNINSPINPDIDYSQSIKQDDPFYFKPENRVGITASIIPVLIGMFTPRGRQYLKLDKMKGFKDSELVNQFYDALAMILRSYPQFKDIKFDTKEKDSISQMFCNDGKANEKYALNDFNKFISNCKAFQNSNCKSTREYLMKRLNLTNIPNLPDQVSASPDGIVVDLINEKIVGVLEIKCRVTRIVNHKGQVINVYANPYKQIPVYYIPQIQWEMLCTGVDKCYFVSWTNSKGIKVFLVDFSIDYCKTLIKYLEQLITEYVFPILDQLDDIKDHHNITEYLNQSIRSIIFNDSDKPNEFMLKSFKTITERKQYVQFLTNGFNLVTIKELN